MIEFRLPSLGADMEEGTLLKWHVKPGDAVRRGQVVAVVDTSKAAVDVEIWQAGVVAELRVQPGEKVPVGAVLATLREAAGEGAPSAAGVVPTVPLRLPVAPPLPQAPHPLAGAAVCEARHRVSPAARQRAMALGLDLERVRGSGAQGAVTLADIEAAARAQEVTAPAAVPVALFQAADRQLAMRQAMAAAMSRSKREIPHYYLRETIPMAGALAWLQQRNAGLSITDRLLPAVLLLKAVAVALQRVPQFNGFYRDGAFQPSAAVHAGVAISLRGGGLVAPAIHAVGDKPLAQLMRELSDLVRRARAGSLRSSEMSDPTITITNLGDQGVATVYGVIYPPQVALVGFGRISPRPWVEDGALCVQPVVDATLAADHRVSEGHAGARFLLELREALQRPQALAQACTTPETNQGTST